MPKIYTPINFPAPPAPQPNLLNQAFNAYTEFQKMQQDKEKRAQDKELYGLKVQEAKLGQQKAQMDFNTLQKNRQDTQAADKIFSQVLSAGLPFSEAEKAAADFLLRTNPTLGRERRAAREAVLQTAITRGDFQTAAELHNALNAVPGEPITAEQAEERYGKKQDVTLGSKQTRYTLSPTGKVLSKIAGPEGPPSGPFELFMQQNPQATFEDYRAATAPRGGGGGSGDIMGMTKDEFKAYRAAEASVTKAIRGISAEKEALRRRKIDAGEEFTDGMLDMEVANSTMGKKWLAILNRNQAVLDKLAGAEPGPGEEAAPKTADGLKAAMLGNKTAPLTALPPVLVSTVSPGASRMPGTPAPIPQTPGLYGPRATNVPVTLQDLQSMGITVEPTPLTITPTVPSPGLKSQILAAPEKVRGVIEDFLRVTKQAGEKGDAAMAALDEFLKTATDTGVEAVKRKTRELIDWMKR